MAFPGNSKITDKDNGYKAMRARMKDLAQGDWTITVGVHDSAGNHGGTSQSVADIALIHEFGAPAANIPARSFIGAWFDLHGRELAQKSTKDLQAFVKGTMTKLQVLARAGSRAVAGIQLRMAQNIPPPLKPATIARKGSSVALIDTGQTRGAVTWAEGKAK